MSKEKKQMIVLGVLALVVVSVGAFQFLGNKSSSAPVVENEDSATQSDGDKFVQIDPEDDNPFGDWKLPETAQGQFLEPFEKRDPFMAQAVIIEDDPDDVDNTTQLPPTPIDTTPPRPPVTITGDPGFGPVDPGPVDGLQSGTPLDEPPFYLAGVIQGSNSTMAIISPEVGPQRIVSVGDKIGKDMTIVAINATEVEVIYKGKNKTLNFRGGN